MKKSIVSILKLLLFSGMVVCGFLYFFQEKFLFHPYKLPSDYVFSFGKNFEEINMTAEDGTRLHGGLFKADSSKGLVFFLHGNSRSLAQWGDIASTYNELNYDIFIFDYRGYGKSEGSLDGEGLFFSDVQLAYNTMKSRYDEHNIVMMGYSIGTGPAAYLAAKNNPKMLVLQAPYYNLPDLVHSHNPVIPTFLLKYKFDTDKYLEVCKMPITLFHGDQDEVIYTGSSVKLKTHLKPTDSLFILKGQSHNGINANPEYQHILREILSKK